jgi:hypothetical protein
MTSSTLSICSDYEERKMRLQRKDVTKYNIKWASLGSWGSGRHDLDRGLCINTVYSDELLPFRRNLLPHSYSED